MVWRARTASHHGYCGENLSQIGLNFASNDVLSDAITLRLENMINVVVFVNYDRSETEEEEVAVSLRQQAAERIKRGCLNNMPLKVFDADPPFAVVVFDGSHLYHLLLPLDAAQVHPDLFEKFVKLTFVQRVVFIRIEFHYKVG